MPRIGDETKADIHEYDFTGRETEWPMGAATRTSNIHQDKKSYIARRGAPKFSILINARLARSQCSMGSSYLAIPLPGSPLPTLAWGVLRPAQLGQHEDTAWLELLAKGAHIHSSMSESNGKMRVTKPPDRKSNQ
jgi:hypothetical protein